MRALSFVLSSLFVLASSCGTHSTPTPAGVGPLALTSGTAPSNLSYSLNPAIYNAGKPIAPNTPTVTGSVSLYTVAPALPGGLALDASTGIITGTPAAVGRPNIYTVTASNFFGATSAALSIRIVPFNLALEPNQGGQAPSMHITGLFWGRLVDVYDFDSASGRKKVVTKSLVIGENIQSDGIDFALETNIVTAAQKVVILHKLGTSAFAAAYARLEQNLVPIADKSLDPRELPPFPLVPRNATVVVRFDDLVDRATLNASTLRIVIGYPPMPGFDARLAADINHGNLADPDGDGHLDFFPTRVLIHMTVSQLEAQGSSPPLAVNSLGLPPSTTLARPNGALRIPTQIDPSSGQVEILRNLAGHGLAFSGNGSTDPLSPTHDIVRAFRSGGDSAVTGDTSNGFLRDVDGPRVIGQQVVSLTSVTPDPSGGRGDFIVDLSFAVTSCSQPASAGDVIQTVGVIAEVTSTNVLPVGGQLTGVRVHVVYGFTPSSGQGQLVSPFDPVADAGKEACFVRFPSISSPPALGVSTDSPVVLRFSEPMDPARLSPFDTMTITRVAGATSALDYVVGAVTPSSDLKEFRFVPVLPFEHTNSNEESYFLNLASGPNGPRDLSGNALGAALPQVMFQLDASAPTQKNGGFALRFSSADELFNDGLPEVRGQFLRDLVRGVLVPRPVSHFAAVADRTQPVPSIMGAFTSGVQTPLSPLGSKLQTLWRYCDVGFALLDESRTNVDVEGLAWSPIGGSAIADSYPLFEINLSHAKHLQDESLEANLLPAFPNSGLQPTFASNVLDPVNDPLRTVHPRARGYMVNPADRFTASTGTIMMPYPLNRGLPLSQFRYYTWRDTALQAKGGPADCPGAELPIVISTLGLSTFPGVPYPTGQVPTIGLPLLMEFKCFPDSGALGLNAFDASLACLSSAKPNFRAFSTGGVNSAGQVVVLNPDLSTVATGGFNPGSSPPGAPTLGVENIFYIGEIDLVVRVSRAHTIWFDTGPAAPMYSAPVIEPGAVDQPSGTRLVLAYRGAVTATGAITSNANVLDPYGDTHPLNGTAVFFNNDATWKPSLAALNGARFFQARVSFISNAETGRTPELSSLGFAFAR